MAHSIQRLTIFALISALELDLREFIQLYLIPAVSEATLLTPDIRKKGADRFQKDNPNEIPATDDLIDYLDIGDELQIIRRTESTLDDSIRTYLIKYLLGLESLLPIRNRVMHSRPLEFDDLMRVSDLSRTLVHSHRSLWANLRTNLRALERDPEFAATLSIPETQDDRTKILHNLPQAEFDDTGFMGRDKELASLKRALSGTYPVVTVVGEGGVGKTALALKACYDILDTDSTEFDAIIWTSAKTTKLTVNEIQLIEGAISSSLGVIESAASSLGRQTGTEAIDDLVEHLTNNKILLIIDNLETIVDQNITYLVTHLPTGSRILFTTRIPLGAFDFPISLQPLNKKDAASYFRTVAKVFGVNDLAILPSAMIEDYCAKLHYNALFIKWFILSVRVGKRPTMVISNPTTFLQFCLQNVFNSLSADTKAVAKVIAGLSEQQTLASLTFYTDLESLKVQSSLSLLITSNLATAIRGRNTEDEDRYSLSSLARAYILKFLRMDMEEQKRLIKKQNELRSAQEQMSARAGIDVFDMNFVVVRAKEDSVVARILTKAVNRIFREELDEANSEIEKAEYLSPNYFEVHRVRAFYYVMSGDYLSADTSYGAAISLAPERAPLRLWYGGFISRSFGDHERALGELLSSEELAPTAATVKLECARVMQYLRRFDEAEQRLDYVGKLDGQPLRIRRVHLDLRLQNEIRRAEFAGDIGDPQRSLDYLERAKEIFTTSDAGLVDYKILKNLNHARRYFPVLRRALRGSPLIERLSLIERWLPFPNEQFVQPFRGEIKGSSAGVKEQEVRSLTDGAIAESIGPVLDNESGELPSNRGRLVQIHKNYGFVDVSGVRYFFHRGSWVGKTDFTKMSEGSIVDFDIAVEKGKNVAIQVRPIEEQQPRSAIGREISGVVSKKFHSHGFINLDVGGQIFFHKLDCGKGTPFTRLSVGDRVKFKVSMSDVGKRFAENVELYSGERIE